MTTVTIKPVSFNVAAKSVLAALIALDNAALRGGGKQTIAMQQYVDAWFIENGKSIESCDSMGKTMRDSEVMINLKASEAAQGIGGETRALSRYATLNNYITGAKRALYFGVAWSAALFTNPDFKIPGGKTSTPSAEKAGKVSVTTLDAAHKTLQKAISQYRLLNQSMLVAAMLDAVQEFYPEFKEGDDTASI